MTTKRANYAVFVQSSCVACPVVSLASSIEGFDESFDGTGGFESSNVQLAGFDNPGWFFDGKGEFASDGLVLDGNPNGEEGGASFLYRDVTGTGSFESSIVFADVDARVSLDASFIMTLTHHFDPEDARNSARISVGESVKDDWGVTLFSGLTDRRSLRLRAGGDMFSFVIRFDAESSEVTFTYDYDISDEIEPEVIGKMDYTGSIAESQVAFAMASTFRAAGTARIDHWSLIGDIVKGDFNDDNILDVQDIDLLSNEVRNGTNDPAFDLGDDDIVDESDRVIWVHDLKKTYFGDSNLDGEFNSSDFVTVFKAGEYEDDIEMNSGWAEGDWNGDGDFGSRDLVFAFQQGGFEEGPRIAAPVPEPSSVLLLATMLFLFTCDRSRG